MQTKRILTSYYKPVEGGFCKRLFRGIHALLKEGHEVHYVAISKFPIDHEKCYYHRFPWPEKYSNNMMFWAVFYCLVPAHLLYICIKHNITDSFAFSASYGLFLQPCRILRKIPLTIFIRGDAIEKHRVSNKPYWLLILDSFLEGLAIHRSKIVGVSDTCTMNLLERHSWAKPNSVEVLRNNIDKPRLRSLKIKCSTLRISVVGSIEKSKNPLFLVDVFKGINPDSYRLKFYGSGSLKLKLMEKILDYGLHESISLKGWVSAESIWQETDLLLMPSLHEGAPNAVLEAIGCDVPVIASNIGAHREILPKESVLAINDASVWEEKINLYVIEYESTSKATCDAQYHYAKKLRFDWDKQFVDQVLASRINVYSC